MGGAGATGSGSGAHPLGMNQLWYYKGFRNTLPSTLKRVNLWTRSHRWPFLLGIVVFNALVFSLPLPQDAASKKESMWLNHVTHHDAEYAHRQDEYWQKQYAKKQLDKLMGGKSSSSH